MPRNRPPSFDFYPDDFIAGTLSMHPTAKGIYITLLCHQWSHGAIPPPTSVRQLVQITGAMPDELSEHLPAVYSKFEEREDGLFENARLRREFEHKCDVREKRKAAGSRGGRPKANGSKTETICLTKSKAKQEVGSRKKEEKKKKASRFNPETVDLPFTDREFVDAWSRWVRHRIQKRAPLTEETTRQLLNRFGEWGSQRSIDAMLFTIEKGWQGIREPDPDQAMAPAGKSTFAQQRIANSANAAKEFLEDDRIR